jgi:hypothetical protein
MRFGSDNNKVRVFAYAKDFSASATPTLEMTGYLLARRPSSSVNLLQKTLPSLLRNATFPLVGKARAHGALNKVQRNHPSTAHTSPLPPSLLKRDRVAPKMR